MIIIPHHEIIGILMSHNYVGAEHSQCGVTLLNHVDVGGCIYRSTFTTLSIYKRICSMFLFLYSEILGVKKSSFSILNFEI